MDATDAINQAVLSALDDARQQQQGITATEAAKAKGWHKRTTNTYLTKLVCHGILAKGKALRADKIGRMQQVDVYFPARRNAT